jgi:hypothetical protein
MELFQPNYEGFFSLMHHQFAGYMYLSNATVQALEIFSPCLEEGIKLRFSKL